MRTIREFEERVHDEFAAGDIPGFVHLYAGEEASARRHLHASQRPRPHRLARIAAMATASPRACDVDGMMDEIFGRGDGLVRRQGRLDAHRRPRPRACWAPTASSAAGAPLVCGAALAAKIAEDGGVGDLLRRRRRLEPGHVPGKPQSRGGLEPAGDLRRREQRLRRSRPRVDWAVGGDSYVDRAAGFGLPGVTVDGTDFFAVYEAAGEVDRAGAGGRRPGAARMQADPLLRPFRGRRADLSRHGRGRGMRAPTRLPRRSSAGAWSRPALLEPGDLDAIDERGRAR